jgi:hypothetical protein
VGYLAGSDALSNTSSSSKPALGGPNAMAIRLRSLVYWIIVLGWPGIFDTDVRLINFSLLSCLSSFC